ncbi:hypothetical protein FHU30_004760 [Actinomadura rupiterrae]|nr:hypothetical protein [Actinomadura rupiterrae]
MHGGFPGIGISTLIYGAVWITTTTTRALTHLRATR